MDDTDVPTAIEDMQIEARRIAMVAVPKGATVPTDHKKPAAQIEAEGITTTDVEWRGHTFTVLTDPDDWSVDATLAFEEGKPASGVRTVLGKEQWAELMKSKPINRDLGDLFDTLAEALGLERVGE